MLKKVLTWGGIAFLVFFIAYRPTSASNVVKEIGSGVYSVAQGFGSFIVGIVGG